MNRRTISCIACFYFVITGCVTQPPHQHRTDAPQHTGNRSHGQQKMTAAKKTINQIHPHKDQLTSDMRSMMQSVTALMTLEKSSNITEAQRRARILRELRILDNAARVIRNGKEITRYSGTNPYLGSFLHDIHMATEFAELDPPDYRPAARLIMSCALCHRQRSP